jgi:hypothetical protein
MAAMDPASTDRYWVDYEGPMGKHTMQFRMDSFTAETAARNSIVGFLQVLLPFVYPTVTFYGLRYAMQGQNVSNPLAWSTLQGTATGVLAPENYPRYISWVGRSSNNRRVRIFLYGCISAVTPDYRLNDGESAPADAGMDYLNSTSSLMVAIDSVRPVWKAYANQGYNAYHQRKRRIVA